MELKKTNTQPNKITLSRQEFNLLEKRIVYCVINQLDPGANDKDLFQNTLVTVPISALGESNYQQIRHATDKLQKRCIHLINNKTEYLSIVPFPRVYYRGRAGVIDITIFSDIMPHFMELRKGYTRYQLQAAISLTTTVSQKMYELLSRFKDTGIWQKVEIEQLKKMLNIQGKYKMFSNFKRYVLEGTRSELSKKTDISFTYTLHKTSRQYTHISFKIYQNKQTDPFHQVDEHLADDKTKRCLKYLQEFGITDKAIKNKIVHEQQSEFWVWLYTYRQNTTAIKNPAGHLINTLNLC